LPRLLVLAGGRWQEGGVQLALAARALVARGHAVTIATPHAEEWRDAVPGARFAPFPLPDGARALRTVVTERLDATRPSIVLTDDDALRRIATRALPDSACVLQRLPLGAEVPGEPFAERFAGRRAPMAWLLADTGAPTAVAAEAAEGRTPARTMPFACAALEPGAAASPHGGARTLLVLADPAVPSGAIPALRAAAAVARREPGVQIRLHGEPADVQSLRVHAAALGVAAQVSAAPLPTLLDAPPPDAFATWVAASGDFAASAALWSLAAGVPVIAPRESDAAAFVSDHVSGLLVAARAPDDDARAASGLSWLLANARASALIAEAARRRASAYTPDRLADRVLDAVTAARRHARR
jgi:hypothetical protein